MYLVPLRDSIDIDNRSFISVESMQVPGCLEVYSPSLRLVQQFAGDPDEHAVGKGRLETRLGELVEHLGDSKTVVLPEVIQQAQGMVLEDRTHTNNSFEIKLCQKVRTDQVNLNWHMDVFAYIKKIQWRQPSTHTVDGLK